MWNIRDDEVELTRQQSRLSRGEGTSQPVIEQGRKESSQAMLSHALVLANQKRGTTRRCRRGVVLRSEVLQTLATAPQTLDPIRHHLFRKLTIRSGTRLK